MLFGCLLASPTPCAAHKRRPRLVVDGVEVPLSVRHTTNEQLNEVFGRGVASYFHLLRWLCTITTVSACTAYAVNCGITLAAASDTRMGRCVHARPPGNRVL